MLKFWYYRYWQKWDWCFLIINLNAHKIRFTSKRVNVFEHKTGYLSFFCFFFLGGEGEEVLIWKKEYESFHMAQWHQQSLWSAVTQVQSLAWHSGLRKDPALLQLETQGYGIFGRVRVSPQHPLLHSVLSSNTRVHSNVQLLPQLPGPGPSRHTLLYPTFL